MLLRTTSSSCFKKAFKFFFFIILISSYSLVLSAQDHSNTGKIQGTWLGELVIPGQVSLRMGIIISPREDSGLKSVLNIIDQGTGDIPCDETTYRNDSVIVRLRKLGIELSGPVNAEGDKIECTFRQRGGVFPVLFSRVEKLPELLRPQEPKSPFPYKVEEVVFENRKDGVRLSGTMTIPEKSGRYPAVIMVTGSGKQNRDEEFAKHKPFMVIADYLTRNGIVVLRYDDRGVGKSTGNFDMASTGDFAEDAHAAITYLKTRTDVNPKMIGIIGHSEGGIVASVVATETSDVAFIVSLAGFMVDFEEVVIEQLMNQARQTGRSEEDIALERSWRKKLYGIAGEKTDSATAAKKMWAEYSKLTEDEIRRLNWPKGRHESQVKQFLNPWWRYNLSLDNRKKLMSIKCPVLALYGALDKQVNADENMNFVEDALVNGKCRKFEVIKMCGLNHMFQTAVTGSEYEYFKIEETFSPEALKLISDWIETTTK